MVKLFDRDFCVHSRLLFRLDGFVQVTQLCIEPRQRRTLFLQPALRLSVLRLLLPFRSVLRVVSS